MFVSYFLIFSTCIILLNTHLVYGKRGCASFGHSCFGGHGKRLVNKKIVPSEMINENANKRISLERDDFSSPERLPNIYDFFRKRETGEVISLLKKWIRLYEAKQRLYKNQTPEYNFLSSIQHD